MNLAHTLRIAVFALVAGSTAALAHGEGKKDQIDAAIAYRQSVYHVILWNYGQMGEMVKGKKPYDAAEYGKRAERVAALASQLEEGFIPGSSGRESTEAKAEIWTSWDDFKSKMGDFERESRALAGVAKTGTFDDVKAQHAKVSAACKACHEKYKAD
jgi:cytochrome c556